MAKKRKFALDKALKKAGMTRYQLAKSLGIEAPNLAKMAKPDYNPTLKTMSRIADHLGCKVADLIDE